MVKEWLTAQRGVHAILSPTAREAGQKGETVAEREASVGARINRINRDTVLPGRLTLLPRGRVWRIISVKPCGDVPLQA